MPVKRRLSKQHDGRITPSVIAAYQRALALRERAHLSDDDRDAAHEAQAAVDRLLGGGVRRMWKISIWDFDDIYSRDTPPRDPRSHDDWARMLELRQRLDAALAEASRRPTAA